VNCDGVVDDEDFRLLIQYAAGLFDGVTQGGCLDLGDPEVNSGFAWGDVNCDGVVDAIDALYLVAYLAGIFLDPVAGNCFTIGTVMT
jgi:hypothetical protein